MDMFTVFASEAIPTPIIAVVFTWVVDTGKPMRLKNKRQIAAAASETIPCERRSYTISTPTVFMIRSPPIAVPDAITMLHHIVIQKGI